MSKAIITESLLTAIADAIREKTGETADLTPAEMAEAIATISGGGDLSIDFLTPSATITELKTDAVTMLRNGGLIQNLPDLETIDLPALSYSYGENFRNLPALKKISLPLWQPGEGTGAISYILYGCPALEEVDLPRLTMLDSYCFNNTTISTKLSLPALTKVGTSNTSRENFSSFHGEEIELPAVTVIQGYNNFNTSSCKKLYAPTCTYLTGRTSSLMLFSINTEFERVELPSLQYTSSYIANFDEASLEDFDAGNLSAISNPFRFTGTGLKNLVLRKADAICTLAATTMVGQNNPIHTGGGYVYVPRALISTYQTATNWSTIYAENPGVFRAVEDYTVDGTLTGRMDWDAM